MISLKVLSTAAIMALALPLAMPSASFADPPHRGGPPGARPAGRPGGGTRRRVASAYRYRYRCRNQRGELPKDLKEEYASISLTYPNK